MECSEMLNNAIKPHPRQKQQRALEYTLVASATAGMFLIEHIKMPQAVSEKKQKEGKRGDFQKKEC